MELNLSLANSREYNRELSGELRETQTKLIGARRDVLLYGAAGVVIGVLLTVLVTE